MTLKNHIILQKPNTSFNQKQKQKPFLKQKRKSMRKEGQNKNKFLRIVSTPFRALNKFYVRSITSCVSRTHYSSSASVSNPFPRSRSSSSSAAFSSSASSRRTTEFGIDDDYSELVRAASVRSLGHKNEIDMFIQEKKLKQGGGLPKSSSVGMARIDEEEEAEEGSVNPKKASDLLYPRSKSYAVTGSPKF